jgi:hypothetical protein
MRLVQDVWRASPMAPTIVSHVALLGVVAARLVNQDKSSLDLPQMPVKIVILTVQHVVVLVQQIAYPVPVENTFLQVHASIVQQIRAEMLLPHALVRLELMPLLGPAWRVQIIVRYATVMVLPVQPGRQLAAMVTVLHVVELGMHIAEPVQQQVFRLLEVQLHHAQRVLVIVLRVVVEHQQTVWLVKLLSLTYRWMVHVKDVMRLALLVLMQLPQDV